jgi:hypothetical protein
LRRCSLVGAAIGKSVGANGGKKTGGGNFSSRAAESNSLAPPRPAEQNAGKQVYWAFR